MFGMEQTMQENRKLRDAIENRFPTHAAFARELNVHERQVSRWIKGQRPYRSQREKIAEMLGTKPHLLWKNSKGAP